MFFGDDSYLSHDIVNYIESEEINNDRRAVEKAVSSYIRIYAQEQNARKYNRISRRFDGSDFSERGEIQSNRETEFIHQNQSNRERTDASSERNIQEISKQLKASDEGASSVSKNEKYYKG